MSDSDTALPNASRPTKGARWGGAVRTECPHCHQTRPKNHQPFCKQNPQRKERIPPAAAIHIAARQAKETAPPMTPPPSPQPAAPAPPAPAAPPPAPVEAPPAAAAPVVAAAAAPREVPIPIREVNAQQAVDADQFMAQRIAELKQNAQPAQRITPRNVQVDSKPRVTFTPSPLLIKLGIGVAAAGLAFYLWRSWRNNDVHAQANRQQAEGRSIRAKRQEKAASQEPQRYSGPRAWTPEPERVATDVIPGPTNLGGGYVPSPQTVWSQNQDDVLRGRQGRP